MLIALMALLHVLVFVYWLGGDLGAFYISRHVSDPTRPAAARIAAAQALNNLDMAPRTALILALPTGLALAQARGILALPTVVMLAVCLVTAVWLALAWRIHLKHLPPGSTVRTLDLAIRWVALTGLLWVGGAVLLGQVDAPLFIGLKLMVLGAAVATGLWVRRLLQPFGPAFVTLVSQGPSPETDAVIARSLARVRPAVMLIWLLLLTAAFLGLWRPQ